MENPLKTSPERDVTKEPYKGPSSTIVGLGYYSAAHHILNIGAVLTLGAAAAASYTHAGKAISKLREWVGIIDKNDKTVLTNWVGRELKSHPLRAPLDKLENMNGIIAKFNPETDSEATLRRMAKRLKKLVVTEEELITDSHPEKKNFFRWNRHILRENERGSFQRIADDFLGFTGLKGLLKINEAKPERIEASLFAAGFGMALGLFASAVYGIFHGGHKGTSGRRQFERAQDQISNLKEDNADLNHINDELHAKYVKAATRLQTINAAREDAARSEASMSSPALADAAPKPEVQLTTAAHDGKLTEQQLEAAIHA